jgi:hypothetical protein
MYTRVKIDLRPYSCRISWLRVTRSLHIVLIVCRRACFDDFFLTDPLRINRLLKLHFVIYGAGCCTACPLTACGLANNAKMTFEMFLPYIVQEGYSIQAIEGDPDAINRLLNDETFRHLVELRYGFKNHLSGEFETAITTAAEIIAEIEKSRR